MNINKDNIVPVTCIILILIGIITSFKEGPTVTLIEDGTAYLVESKWWGLKHTEREIKLINDEWNIKSSNGEWEPIYFVAY